MVRFVVIPGGGGKDYFGRKEGSPTDTQLRWLRRGLAQPGGKLPLFDEGGQRINERTVRSCIASGWAKTWFENPIKPDWLVCKLTEKGRLTAKGHS